MDTALKIYNDIIKAEGFFFRGIPLGSSLEDVEKIEGDDYYEVLGSLPHYEYYLETGEKEEIFLYYGFEEDVKEINYIRLFLYAYPKIYWKKLEGGNDVDFYHLLKSGELGDYSKNFDNTTSKIIESFEAKLGSPIINDEDEVFDQPYHKFKKYIWRGENGIFLSATTYIDDSVDNNVRQVLHLFLTKE